VGVRPPGDAVNASRTPRKASSDAFIKSTCSATSASSILRVLRDLVRGLNNKNIDTKTNTSNHHVDCVSAKLPTRDEAFLIAVNIAQTAKRAAADIEGHSTAAEFCQSG